MEEQIRPIYLYRIQPFDLRIINNPNQEELEIIDKHFSYLKDLTEKGLISFVGRTLNIDPQTFGIVVLNTKSEDEAKEIMLNDPAVKMGIMKSDLFPFKVVMLNKNLF